MGDYIEAYWQSGDIGDIGNTLICIFATDCQVYMARQDCHRHPITPRLFAMLTSHSFQGSLLSLASYIRGQAQYILQPVAELIEMLKSHEVDFDNAFCSRHLIEGIESHILFQNHLAAIVAKSDHPKACGARDDVTLEDLSAYGARRL